MRNYLILTLSGLMFCACAPHQTDPPVEFNDTEGDQDASVDQSVSLRWSRQTYGSLMMNESLPRLNMFALGDFHVELDHLVLGTTYLRVRRH